MSEILLHSPADVFRYLLILRGLATLPTVTSPQPPWPAYVEDSPADPDNCIALYTQQGNDHGRTAPDRERQTHHGVQILIRSSSYVAGWQKTRAITLSLDQVYQVGVVIDGTSYVVHSANRTSEALGMGPEPGTHRRLFSVNLTASILAL